MENSLQQPQSPTSPNICSGGGKCKIPVDSHTTFQSTSNYPSQGTLYLYLQQILGSNTQTSVGCSQLHLLGQERLGVRGAAETAVLGGRLWRLTYNTSHKSLPVTHTRNSVVVFSMYLVCHALLVKQSHLVYSLHYLTYSTYQSTT